MRLDRRPDERHLWFLADRDEFVLGRGGVDEHALAVVEETAFGEGCVRDRDAAAGFDGIDAEGGYGAAFWVGGGLG